MGAFPIQDGSFWVSLERYQVFYGVFLGSFESIGGVQSCPSRKPQSGNLKLQFRSCQKQLIVNGSKVANYQLLIDRFGSHHQTGVLGPETDVARSNNPIGSEGGDWVLDRRVGLVQADVPGAFAALPGLLAANTIPSKVSTFSPADSAMAVAGSSNITLSFSEAIAGGTGNIEIRQGSVTDTLVKALNAATRSRLTISGSSLKIDPTSDLASATQYLVTLAVGSIKDLAGSSLVCTSDTVTRAPTANSTAQGVVSVASHKFSDTAGPNAKPMAASSSLTTLDDTVVMLNQAPPIQKSVGFEGAKIHS